MADTTSVTNLIYAAAGSPPGDGAMNGVCRSCGGIASGLPFSSWVRDTFMDFDKLRPGEIICHACQFCFTDRNERLTAILGKDKPQRMRNYSHFIVGGRWTPVSKGGKPEMKRLLLSSPDVAVIATSGQKHIIFRARPGWWQIEEAALQPFPRELSLVLEIVEALYAGFTKAEIETGRYRQSRIMEFGLSEWRTLEAEVKPRRGTAALQLALFLAQKEDENE